MSEVRSLHDSGYVSNGQWTLGQTCGHVANWMRYPLDGFPKPPLPMRAIFWIMKYTIAPGMKRKILAEGFKSGMPTAPDSVPRQDEMSDQQGVDQLQEVVDRVKSHTGDLNPSPLFGPMDKEMHETVTLLHAEHHLGFLEAK